MAWKATLKDKSLNEGTLTLVVVYSDGKDSFTETYTNKDGNLNLQNTINDKIAQLTRLQATYDKTAKNAVLNEKPAVATPPTAEELALSEYALQRNNLIKAKQNLELGLINQATYDTLLAEVLLLGKNIGVL